MASVRNTLNRLRTEIGDSAIRALDRELEERCFMLGWMDAPTESLPPKVVEGLRRLVGAVQRSIQPTEPIPVIPVYDPASLMFAVQAATMDFHQRWNAKLGFGGRDGERKEHWTRVKALNRRIADRWDIEYDTLTPVADLTTRLSEEISDFLERPVEWQGDQADDEDQRARAVDSVRRSVSAVVHRISLARLIDEHLQEWVTAYSYSGTGSTFVRARDIRNIYEEAAPILGKVVDPGTREFLDSLRQLVGEAIAEGGGKVLYEVPTRPRPVTSATSDS